MMAFLRGKVAKVIFGALLVAFLAFIVLDFGAGGKFGGGSLGAVAVVGGERIPAPEFDTLYNNEMDTAWAGVRDQLNESDERQIRKQVLDRLVDQTLAWQGARRLGIAYSDEEVQNAIHGMPAFMNQQGQFDPYRYQAQLSRLGLAPAVFETDQQRAMSANRVESLIRDAVRVTDLELWLEYLRWHRRMKVALVSFPLADAKAKERVTDAELKAYWDNDQAQYKAAGRSEFQKPERVHIRHIVVAAAQAGGPEALAQAKAKMDTVVADLKAGKPFAEVARARSDDGNTALRGGDLGWRVKGELIPEYDKVVFKLAPGQVSAVFQTQFGYHLIKCEAHEPAEHPTFEEVRGRIRDRLVTARARAKLLAEATRASWAAKQAKNLTAVATLTGRPVRDLGWVRIGGARPAGLSASAFQDVAEALAGCEPGDLTPVVPTPEGYVIAQLLDEVSEPAADQKSRLKQEEEFRAQRLVIEPVLLARKQQAAWDAWLAAARAKTKITKYLETGA